MSRFTLPRDIYYGPGALDELKVLAGHKKAMIFTGGSSMRRGGFLQKTEEVLKAAGLETARARSFHRNSYERRTGHARI